MPYSIIAELPPYVKKYSKKLQSIWMKVFNSAYKQYDGDESRAFKVANAAVRKQREKHSKDYDDEFKGDIGKFMKHEQKEQERNDDYYGNDFHNQLDEFLRD